MSTRSKAAQGRNQTREGLESPGFGRGEDVNRQRIIRNDSTLDRSDFRVTADVVFDTLKAMHEESTATAFTTCDIASRLAKRYRGISHGKIERSVRAAVFWLCDREVAYVAGHTVKTTAAGWLLTTIPDSKRIFTIENGSRELELVREENGKVVNSVVHTLTRDSENERQRIDQGARVADWVIQNFQGEKGMIIELEGTTGSSPANDRKKGFDDKIASDPRFEILESRSGDFARDEGRKVMETLLQAHPDVNIVYAHNDEMAIGAIQALEAAGRKPGEDVMVVSIDGTRDALQAIIDGKMGVTVESSPFFGPLACETMKRYAAGETIEPWIKVEDRIFTKENAADHVGEAY